MAAMPPLTIYQKPTCTTCRKAVAELNERGLKFTSVDLFENPPTVDELRELCRKLGVTPREILRRKDPAYADHDLGSLKHTDAQVLSLMAKNPGLIQRPILVRGSRAVLARPVEKLSTLLD
jgi:arsenate reductase (glutaredoxin)